MNNTSHCWSIQCFSVYITNENPLYAEGRDKALGVFVMIPEDHLTLLRLGMAIDRQDIDVLYISEH